MRINHNMEDPISMLRNAFEVVDIVVIIAEENGNR